MSKQAGKGSGYTTTTVYAGSKGSSAGSQAPKGGGSKGPSAAKSATGRRKNLLQAVLALPGQGVALTRRTMQGVRAGAARLRRSYRISRHWLAVNAPRERLRRWRWLYLRPRRLAQGWRSFVLRLRGRRAWDGSPALVAVYKAIRWGKSFRRHASRVRAVEALRSRLYADSAPLNHLPGKPTMGELARRDVLLPRWGALLHGLVFHSSAQRVLEINTGFGLSTLYLARGLLDAYPVRTCMLVALGEGSPYLPIARKHLAQLGYNDFVTVREGTALHSLAGALESVAPPDLVFIARQAAAFEAHVSARDLARIKALSRPGTLIVFEDIHASPGMEHAWDSFRRGSRIAAAIDLWRWGILVIGSGPARQLDARL